MDRLAAQGDIHVGLGGRDHREGHGNIRKALEEMDLYRRRGIKLDLTELDLGLVADVGVDALDHLRHQILALELQDFVGDVGAVDEVVIGVQTGA